MTRSKQRRKQQCASEMLILFVKLRLLVDTPPVLSLGKLCEDHRYFHEWAEKLNLIKKLSCNTDNSVPTVVPRLSSEASSSSWARPPQDTAREKPAAKKKRDPILGEPAQELSLARRNPLQDLPGLLKELIERLVGRRSSNFWKRNRSFIGTTLSRSSTQIWFWEA